MALSSITNRSPQKRANTCEIKEYDPLTPKKSLGNITSRSPQKSLSLRNNENSSETPSSTIIRQHLENNENLTECNIM